MVGSVTFTVASCARLPVQLFVTGVPLSTCTLITTLVKLAEPKFFSLITGINVVAQTVLPDCEQPLPDSGERMAATDASLGNTSAGVHLSEVVRLLRKRSSAASMRNTWFLVNIQ